MKQITFLTALFLHSIFLSAQTTKSSYLVTATQFGMVSKTTTYTDLEKLFGKQNLREETRTGAEGEGEYKVTIVYKDKPQELVIIWQENRFHKKIGNIAVEQSKSPYYTKDSLLIGSNLNALIKVNKAPVSFYGFEWDYGGLITKYHNGALAKSKVIFSLGWYGSDKDMTLLGDSEFTSTASKVSKRAAQVKISRMEVNWE